METHIEIGALLRKWRENSGLTQEEVGNMIGKSKSVVSQYETGRLKITFDTVQKYCGALGISVRELFFDEQPIFPGEVKGEVTERILRKVMNLSDEDKIRLVGYIDALGGGE